MAYVSVPSDLSKIKTKIAFNLTKRQLVCFGSAAAIGIPTYLLARTAIGNMGAMLLMIALMLPFFFLAMYERDGLPAEKVFRNIIRATFLWPRVRPYKTENIYAFLNNCEMEVHSEATDKKTSAATKRQAKPQARPTIGPADHTLPGNAPGRRVSRQHGLLHKNR